MSESSHRGGSALSAAERDALQAMFDRLTGSYYEVLGVARDCDRAALRGAFFEQLERFSGEHFEGRGGDGDTGAAGAGGGGDGATDRDEPGVWAGTAPRGDEGACDGGAGAGLGASRELTGIGVRLSRMIAGGGCATSRPYMGGGVFGLVRCITGSGVRLSRTGSSTPRRSDARASRRS